MSYNSVLHDLCGDEVCREFFCKPNSSPCELGAAEQLPISAAASSSAGVLNEANVNSLVLAALKQLEDQATVAEGYEQLGTAQKNTKDTSQIVNFK